MDTDIVAKPVATYKSGSLNEPLVKGECARLTCVTHPAQQLRGKQLTTSTVTRIGSFGVFETLNTVYMPDRKW